MLVEILTALVSILAVESSRDLGVLDGVVCLPLYTLMASLMKGTAVPSHMNWFSSCLISGD